MLEFLRRSASSFVVKILLGLLIASFALWGIRDIFNGGTNAAAVATVGGTDVSAELYRTEFAQELKRLSQVLGKPLSHDQALAMGLDSMVISRLINTAVIQQGAKDLGVLASTSAVVDEVHNTKAFQDAQGRFDRNTFDRLLSENGFTETSYLARVKADLERVQFLSPIISGTLAPKELLSALYTRLAQKRVLDVVRIAHAAIKNVPSPSADDLVKYHKDHAAQFMAPQYRSVTALVLSADALGKTIKISAEDLKKAYAERGAEYNTPQSRTLSQILVKDQATAKRAVALLAKGMAFEKVVKAVGANPALVKIGAFTYAQAGTLSKALADVVFATKKGAYTQPVQSPLGWHVLQVDTITPSHSRPLSEVKAELTKAVRADRALNALYKASNKLQDLLGGGMTLEEAGRKMGRLPTIRATVDAQGLDQQRRSVAMAYAPELLDIAFKTTEDQDSPLTDAKDGKAFLIVHVNKIIPPTLRPLKNVRDQVAAAWRNARRSAMAAKVAQSVKKRMEAGESATSIAKGNLDLEAFATAPFNRQGQGLKQGDLSNRLVTKTFALKSGQIVIAEDGDAHTVARLKSVVNAKVDTKSDLYRQIAGQTLSDMQSDLVAQLSAALQIRYPVSVNQNALSTLNAAQN